MYKQKLGDSFHNYNARTMHMDEIFYLQAGSIKMFNYSTIDLVTSLNLFESCLNYFLHHEVNRFDEMMQETESSKILQKRQVSPISMTQMARDRKKFYFRGSLKVSYFSYYNLIRTKLLHQVL